MKRFNSQKYCVNNRTHDPYRTGLSLALRLLPMVHSDAFYSSPRTVLFSHTEVESTSE